MPPGIAVFRCDASAAIGGGHVVRSMALATAFADAGWQVGFAVASTTRAVVPALSRQGWRVESGFQPGDSGAQALRRMWPRGAGVAIVDSYALAAPEEAALRPWASRLLIIDDLVDRPHDCDLLLDQTLGREARDYAALLPSGARVLAGPRYALLRPEFAAARAGSVARRRAKPDVARILISLGATDAGGITLGVVEAVRAASATAALDVVVGAAAASLPGLRAIAARDPGVVVHVDTAEMARLMSEADLAVGAAGTSAWERCCLGLPTVMLVLADNQRGVAAALAEAGAARPVEPGPKLGPLVTDAVRELLVDHAGRARLSAAAATVTDGLGAGRVVAEFTALYGRGER